MALEMNSVHRIGLTVILFDNLTADYGFVIGRADKRYTLWKYNKVSDANTGNCRMNIEFVQVLSPDRNKVAIRFPDVFICEELRGESRMTLSRGGKSKSRPTSAPKTIWDFEAMPFGELRGVKFGEMAAWRLCKLANNVIRYEMDYKWTDAWGEEFDFEELIMNKLQEFGCRFIAGQWYNPEQLEKPGLWMYLANTNTDPEKQAEYDAMCESFDCIRLLGKWFTCTPGSDNKEWQNVAREILPKAEMGMPFEFVAPYNSHSFFFGVRIEFLDEDKATTSTYYGTTRFLRVTNKKGVKVNKRPKGKTIEVLEYEVKTYENGEAYILVNKFNIR